MRLTIIALWVLALLGCKTPEDTIVGKPPETGVIAATEPARKVPQQVRFPTPRLSIASWPYVEQGRTFTLTWNGGDKRVPLHAAPDANSRVLGDVVWDNGERILWQDTVVASYRPRVVRANAEWFAEGPVYEDGYLVDQEFLQLEIKKGERVEVWAYAGDGQCYMSRRSKIITGPCPPAELFSGLAQGVVAGEWYMPEQKVWWIQISGDNLSGWVPVDDRMVVDMVSQ